MDKYESKKLGDECVNHLMELNPRGGIKDFVRMAVEYGFNKAREKDIQIIKKQFITWNNLAEKTSDGAYINRVDVLADLLESLGVSDEERYEWEQIKN